MAGALADELRKGLDLSGKSLEEAVRLLADRKLEELQLVLNEQAKRESLIAAQLALLQSEHEALEARRAKLEAENAQLQRQKDLLSTGLIAAGIALLAAVLGQIPKWVTLPIDLRLKKVELQERELSLSQRKQGTPGQMQHAKHEPDEDR